MGSVFKNEVHHKDLKKRVILEMVDGMTAVTEKQLACCSEKKAVFSTESVCEGVCLEEELTA